MLLRKGDHKHYLCKNHKLYYNRTCLMVLNRLDCFHRSTFESRFPTAVLNLASFLSAVNFQKLIVLAFFVHPLAPFDAQNSVFVFVTISVSVRHSDCVVTHRLIITTPNFTLAMFAISTIFYFHFSNSST